jgi:hypothetical protein
MSSFGLVLRVQKRTSHEAAPEMLRVRASIRKAHDKARSSEGKYSISFQEPAVYVRKVLQITDRVNPSAS